MSKHEKKGTVDCLFTRQDMKLINVKFFRGDSDIISEEEFNSERACAAERKRTGEVVASPQAPRCKRAPIDLRQLVADMA
jgi:hypothetical protein